jgi:hypothetical protein
MKNALSGADHYYTNLLQALAELHAHAFTLHASSIPKERQRARREGENVLKEVCEEYRAFVSALEFDPEKYDYLRREQEAADRSVQRVIGRIPR